jgi:hypothetical protein
MRSPTGSNVVPAALSKVFRCVRPVIFRDPAAPDFPSVPGTGFLLELFGEVFFITARHVVDRGGFDVNNLRVVYSLGAQACIPFAACNTYESLDIEDTSHVDIIVLRADKQLIDFSLFLEDRPFNASGNYVCRSFSQHERMFFKAVVPEQNVFDYENNKFSIEFAIGDFFYVRSANYRSVHRGSPNVTADCPDFDGMSGGPVFSVPDPSSYESPARFAGMLVIGSRKDSILHFMDAECVLRFLLDYFLGGLDKIQSTIKLSQLVQWHLPDIGQRYAAPVLPYSSIKLL